MRLWILLAAGFGCVGMAISMAVNMQEGSFNIAFLGLMLLLVAVQTAPKPRYRNKK